MAQPSPFLTQQNFIFGCRVAARNSEGVCSSTREVRISCISGTNATYLASAPSQKNNSRTELVKAHPFGRMGRKATNLPHNGLPVLFLCDQYESFRSVSFPPIGSPLISLMTTTSSSVRIQVSDTPPNTLNTSHFLDV